ncbi:MAG: hypothetical protein HY234_01875 [Acidobacteria bacterium]|nr:hypothetical protein [Acidobacteriota bacterium]
MSKADVRGLWGEPREVVPDPKLTGTETWTYERTVGSGAATEGRSARAVVRRTIYRLTFTNDRVTKIVKQVL